jgi:hypothetical protein
VLGTEEQNVKKQPIYTLVDVFGKAIVLYTYAIPLPFLPSDV